MTRDDAARLLDAYNAQLRAHVHDRLPDSVRVERDGPLVRTIGFAHHGFVEYRDLNKAFYSVGAYTTGAINLGSNPPSRPVLGLVTPELMPTLGVPTARGPIPSDAAEVNGSMLQVLARRSWLRDDPRLTEMGRRVAAAYLDDTLPVTGDIPPERWDFVAQNLG